MRVLLSIAIALAGCGAEVEPVGSAPEPDPVAAEPHTEPARAGEPAAEPEPEPPPVRNESCDHRFIPSDTGAFRRYRWVQSGEERAAELTLEVVSSRAVDDEREVRWRARVIAADDGSELGAARIDVRCRPGADMEEPYFGVIEQSLGMHAVREGVRWRWPVELRPGVRFEGDAAFDPTGVDAQGIRPGPQVVRIHRAYVVEARETIQTRAGRFDAWRVRFEERHAYADRSETGTGTMWMAEGAGLVRSRSQNSEGVTSTLELITRRD